LCYGGFSRCVGGFPLSVFCFAWWLNRLTSTATWEVLALRIPSLFVTHGLMQTNQVWSEDGDETHQFLTGVLLMHVARASNSVKA
jgi:hypothetical protein